MVEPVTGDVRPAPGPWSLAPGPRSLAPDPWSLVPGPLLAGLSCALTVGWRPQFAIAVVPMLVVAVVLSRTWRARRVAVIAFGVACLAWVIPAAIATGGPSTYWRWISGQAAYYAAHDAGLSRSGQGLTHIVLRFAAHPWGLKWLSVPVLGAAAAGLVALLVPRAATHPGGAIAVRLLPLAAGSLTYLAFGTVTMDPGDAVRYAIPSLPLVAALAGIALSRLRLPLLLALAYTAGAYWYAFPILRARSTSASPPAAAAAWIRANAPPNATIVGDRPLGPHTKYFLRGFAAAAVPPLDPSTPVFLFIDGERGESPGVTFRWADTDAYRKLTRQHYRAASVVALPPEQRFHVLEGVHPVERAQDGASWHWVASRGVIELPQLGASAVELTFRLPPAYPFEANAVAVSSGTARESVTIARGSTVRLRMNLEGTRITITPQRTFVPARIEGADNPDPRTLSVMLTGIRQLSR